MVWSHLRIVDTKTFLHHREMIMYTGGINWGESWCKAIYDYRIA